MEDKELNDVEFFNTKPEMISEEAEKDVEVTQKEFDDQKNYYRNGRSTRRCYRRCGIAQYNGRHYKRCSRRCYRVNTHHLEKELNDVEFFNTSPEMISEDAEKDVELTKEE
jgi:hypothetical protein